MLPASRVPLRYSVLDLHGMLETNDTATLRFMAFPPTRPLAWATFANVLLEAGELQVVQHIKDNEALNERLHYINHFRDDAARTYSPALLPASVMLLPLRNPLGGPPLVCILCKNVPQLSRDSVTIWLCGRVVYTNLEVDVDGAPQKWNVCIEPLDKELHKHALALQAAFSASCDYVLPSVLPPVFCYSPRRVNDDGRTVLMTYCWDATSGVTSPRSSMPSINAADLAVNDLVLAELWLVRHIQPGEPHREKSFYHMRSMCVLARAGSYELNA